MTKLLVGLGWASGRRTQKSIEIIDLKTPSTTCKSLTSFPLALKGSFGGLGFHDNPTICGENDGAIQLVYKCFSLKGNIWTLSPGLNTKRGFAAVSRSPYPSNSQKFFVTGGKDKSRKAMNTAEVLTEQGWEILPQTLPVKIYAHCSVLVNSTTVMVIGGFQNGSISTNTYYFNTEKENWTEGPQLKIGRFDHSCGIVWKDSQSKEFSLIVAGGWSQSILSSVEILDLGSNNWRTGPNLPFGIYKSEIVVDQIGGVVLVGGNSISNHRYLDTLFKLPHGGEGAKWIKMEQKLKIGRNDHVAFLVPDNIVDCS